MCEQELWAFTFIYPPSPLFRTSSQNILVLPTDLAKYAWLGKNTQCIYLLPRCRSFIITWTYSP